MNFKKSALAGLIGLSLASSATAFDADSWEVSGFVKNETAVLQKDGTFNGQATGPTDTTEYNSQGDAIKSETTLKLFVNGALAENADVHAELNLVRDSQGTGDHFKTSEAYTQNDALRELYVDSLFGSNHDIEVRLGKQQVVWGSADGAKLLDIINPTDYREMAQNTMEDSRIPVWMLNVNAPVGDAGNIQFIASQPRENVFAGLNRDVSERSRTSTVTYSPWAYNNTGANPGHDQGNAFILKGVDTITGQRNGFLNIVPDLGNAAYLFTTGFSAGGSTVLNTSFSGTSVDVFSQFDNATLVATANSFSGNTVGNLIYTMASGNSLDGAGLLAAFQGFYDSNLASATNASDWGNGTTRGTQDSTFEYMSDASMGTFVTFAGATSQYIFDMPDDLDLNLATRYRNSLDNGLNYSLAYAYAYGKNPVIDLDWYTASGTKLYTQIDSTNNMITLNDAADGSGSDHNVFSDGAAPVLKFTQTLEREHNLGASFDYTVDSESLGGVVLRGEFLYTKDQRDPVIDRGRLAIGDLAGGLKMQKSDHFKYVLGADITVLTNMLVSGQFIQDRNLDYVDTSSAYGTNQQKYTADFAGMHLTNGLQKARENKEFYSLFLSKPFGPNQLGRWNNILMLEEGGGRWNRFDVEYSFTDQLIGTFELNNYWGDKNTQFGQLEDASNLQLGVKYLF